jgi:hypothetical protein
MSTDPPTQRYKFIVGKGDVTQENLLNTAADQDGFRATMIVFDASGVATNSQIVVLMEKET